MKLLQWLPLSLAALSASAQVIALGAPANGSSIAAGSNVTVRINQPNGQSSWVDIGIGIGFGSCVPGSIYSSCFPADATFGAIMLYKGAYDPVWQEFQGIGTLLTQTFELTIPGDAPLGQAQLNVAALIATGESLSVWVDYLTIMLNIV